MHGAAEFHGIAAHGADVDDVGEIDHLLEFHQAAFVMALLFFGGVIFGVFRQIPMRARFRNRFDDAMAFGAFEAFQL